MADGKMPVGVWGGCTPEGAKAPAELGITTVQLSVPWPEARTEQNARMVREAYAEAGVDISIVFCGFEGESYKTIQIVRETVGLVPPATHLERVQDAKDIADFAAWVGAEGIGIHIGAVSEDWDSPDFARILADVKEVADHCAARGITMNLETGQETAKTLLHLLESAGRDNLFVNFDPANMILYGSGEPLEALRLVGDYVRSCHCKDAVWSDDPGNVWGVETPLGEGDVNMRQFVATLDELGYTAPLTIECEISGADKAGHITNAIQLLKDIKKDLGIE
ncbi:MAG: sugar phosphate isomerase/epimerase [Planctomycetes bacterium]|nr:sugar phosphate isomerase/epimerase [Planctomycetota bacterium]